MKIGLEIHVQLPTKTKLFCSCSTEAEKPNRAICPTCLGFPGSKPSLNKKALEYAIKISKMMNCQIADRTWFSRKTYFYPDLAKNFQITQYESPIGKDGQVVVDDKKIRIRRVHIEEDPAKMLHDKYKGQDFSLIDYNRSGIPLVEIVTEPDISSPKEARNFLKNLKLILDYVDVNIEKDGSIRTDANISVDEERVEIKNINGLKNVERALEFEYKRQSKLLKFNMKIVMETRHFDENTGATIESRSKEAEAEYGYIFEPDLPVLRLNEFKLEIAEMPEQKLKRLIDKFKISEEQIKDLWIIIHHSKSASENFESWGEECIEYGTKVDVVWFKNNLLPLSRVVTGTPIILRKLENGEISDFTAKKMFKDLIEKGEIGEYKEIEKDDSKLLDIVNEFFKENTDAIEDAKQNPKALNFIIGQIMKKTQGKYDSKKLYKIVKNKIDKK